MLSNCMMSNTREITNICRCAELTDTLNTWGKRFITIIIMSCYFEIFSSCQRSMRTFSKNHSKCKTVLIKFRKTMPIIKFSQDNPQNNFLNSLTSKFWRYPWNTFETYIRGCSSNILEALLRDYWNLPKDQHMLLSNHTLLTQKQLFHRELFKKSFPLNCSLNIPWMSRTMQRWANT